MPLSPRIFLSRLSLPSDAASFIVNFLWSFNMILILFLQPSYIYFPLMKNTRFNTLGFHISIIFSLSPLSATFIIIFFCFSQRARYAAADSRFRFVITYRYAARLLRWWWWDDNTRARLYMCSAFQGAIAAFAQRQPLLSCYTSRCFSIFVTISRLLRDLPLLIIYYISQLFYYDATPLAMPALPPFDYRPASRLPFLYLRVQPIFVTSYVSISHHALSRASSFSLDTLASINTWNNATSCMVAAPSSRRFRAYDYAYSGAAEIFNIARLLIYFRRWHYFHFRQAVAARDAMIMNAGCRTRGFGHFFDFRRYYIFAPL